MEAGGRAWWRSWASWRSRRAVANGASAGAADPPNIYQQDDYADGQAMYVLPPGENGLVNPTQALEFEATGKRPAASDDQLSQYADLLYGASTLTDDRADRLLQRRVVRCQARGRDQDRDTRGRRHDLPRPARRAPHLRRDQHRRCVRGRLRAGRGPAVHDGCPAPLRLGHAGLLPRGRLRLRADGPRPAAAGAVHTGAGAGPDRRAAQAVRRGRRRSPGR